MLELKKDQNSRIVMYGKVNKYALNEFHKTEEMSRALNIEFPKILFSGTRSGLLEKDEEFWKEIVKRIGLIGFEDYKNYYSAFLNAKNSGHSALSLIKEEYILIVKEKI